MPQISVIIPVYKVEDSLRQCVDSVLQQTFTDCEIILVDDGSPDNCGAICDEYKDKYDNITVIHQQNGGLSAARNAGLKKMRGEYVMFLDSDDHLAEDCLQTLSGHDADMVIGSTVNVYNGVRQLHQPRRDSAWIYPEDYAEKLPDLIEGRWLNYVHAKLYRSSVITQNHLCFEDDMLTSAEDTVFNFTFLKHCKSIFVIPKPLHFYIQNTSGLGKKFYPDRYERFCRLNDFVVQVCRELGIYSGKMAHVLRLRRAYSAIFSMEGILIQRELSRSEKAALLDRIASDPLLAEAVDNVSFRRKDDLRYLIKRGGNRFILREYRRSYLKKAHSKITSPFKRKPLR